MNVHSCTSMLQYLNPFLFIRGLSYPSRVQTSLNQNCLKLTITGYPYNCLPVFCGDIGIKKIPGLLLTWKSGLKVPLLPLEPSCPLQKILLSDLIGCDSPRHGPLAHFFLHI